MLQTLRGRLILSYVGVVLPALLLATGVYLVLSLRYQRDDAYRQLQTGLYLVSPQVEVALGQRVPVADQARVLAATGRIRNALVQIEAALGAGLTAPDSARIHRLAAQSRDDIGVVESVFGQDTLAAEKTRVLGAAGRIGAALDRIDAVLGGGHTLPIVSRILTATGYIRGELSQIDEAVGPRHILDIAGGIQTYTNDIRTELQQTRFRLVLVQPNGLVVLDSLHSGGYKGDLTGTHLALPAALSAHVPITAPVQGSLARDAAGATWIYEVAPPRLLLGKTPNAGPPAFFVLLAQHDPDFSDVVQAFLSRFLVFGAVALAVALVLGAVLALSITRPLAALAAATHQIAQGNYAHQAPVTGSVEMRELAGDFNRMAGRVRTVLQAQRDFLANVSHDLKTPLTTIGGFSQAMLDGTLRDRASFVDAAAVIHAETGRMARLVADLVDLVRLQSGETPITKEPVDLPGLLHGAALGMQPQATERHVELRVEAGPLPPVPADPDRLRRAITNLLDNAVRHTPPEGRVTLRTEGLPGAVRIHVLDTGEGIPEGDLPRIFERFYQVDKSRAGAGGHSGLGLAIVREIATAHGGEVSVASQPGAGSDFAITLPTGAAGRPGAGLNI